MFKTDSGSPEGFNKRNSFGHQSNLDFFPITTIIVLPNEFKIDNNAAINLLSCLFPGRCSHHRPSH